MAGIRRSLEGVYNGPKPMPSSVNKPYRARESKGGHRITHKGTQPSQTCSGGFINT